MSLRFLTVKDDADDLAILESQVYTLVKKGEVPAIQVGPKRVWQTERTRLEEYIERQYAVGRDAVKRAEPF
ncbi:DNA-binding protein [Isoptericola sp. NPDC057191]|uniref:DNA-binding protein n=1 Tax=Isoptericola sp. NPDC057191 TaxID=3346041 RepID=UPI00362BE975